MARLASLLLLALAFVAVALASGGADDPASHEATAEGSTERQLTVQATGAQVDIRSDYGASRFEVIAQFDSNIPRLRAKYSSDGSNNEGDSRLWPIALVEFTDGAGGSDGFDAAVDSVKATLSYSTGTWGQYTAPVENPATGVWSFSVTHTATGGALTTFTVFFSNSSFDASGSLIPAKAVKFDVSISGYTYVAVGSKLALQLRLQTEISNDFNEGNSTSDDFVELSPAAGAPVSGFLQWATTLTTPAGVAVIQTGFQTSDVCQSSCSGDDSAHSSRYGYFAFNTTAQPAAYLWDPILGVSGSASALAASFLLLAACLFLLF